MLVALWMEGELRRKGYEVEVCADGSRLPALLADFDPQMIFLDIRLGTSDAFHVIAKQLSGRFGGVVSLCSGSPLDFIMDVMVAGERRGLLMGAPLAKPMDEPDLLDSIEAAELILSRRLIAAQCRTENAALNPVSRLSLREAIDGEALEVWYQPKYDLWNRRVSGAEGLIRARLPDGQIVGPGELLPGATKNDLHELTDYVLKQSIADSHKLAIAGTPHRLSVNMPVSFLLDRDVASYVRPYASQIWWPGMTFEVTEDEALANEADVRDAALQLKLYAVELSIDDFGAGYSSLPRLRDLPFRELKLDRSFVHGCASDSTKTAICRSVITLGQELGCITVAEGVELEEDAAVMLELGCEKVQGYLFGRPAPFADLCAMLKRGSTPGTLALQAS